MIWTRRLMRTAFIFLVTMTVPTYESAAEIRTLWIPLAGMEEMGAISTLETDEIGLYAGTEHGVFISLDNGYTWRLTEFKLPVKVMATSPQSIYVGSDVNDGLFQSDDRGKTWEPLNNGLGYIDENNLLGDDPVGYGVYKYIVHTPYGTINSVMACCTDVSAAGNGTWRDTVSNWRVDDTEWILGYGIRLLYGMDHYLVAGWVSGILRSREGQPGGRLISSFGGNVDQIAWPTARAVLDDRVYVAGRPYLSNDPFFARYEPGSTWKYLNVGLPESDGVWLRYNINSFAVNRGRIFAGLDRRGVWVFDERSETWIPAGLDGLTVTSLVSHQSDLYAATKEGIYRASIPTVQPYGKAAATWGAVKTR